jgi:hypothetical protein
MTKKLLIKEELSVLHQINLSAQTSRGWDEQQVSNSHGWIQSFKNAYLGLGV